MSELDALDSVPEQLTLSTGTVVEFNHLKARQFFKMLRILTHATKGMIGQLDQLFSGSGAEAAAKFAALLVFSIPDAEDETIEFLFSMVRPAGLRVASGGRSLEKSEVEFNQKLWDDMANDINNPELEDLIDLVDTIVKREAEDLTALGKKLQKLLGLAKKTGQLTTSQTSQEQNSSEVSPEASTLSVASTTGRTNRSKTARSND